MWKLVIVLGVSLAATSVHAERLELNLFGAEVQILGTRDGPWNLTVNGKKLVSDYVLGLSRVGMMAGVGYALGKAGGGGNACDTPPFVISFPPGKPARIDGPISACSSVDVVVSEDKITFREVATAGDKTSEWTWTPADGLRRREVVQAASNKIDWDSLRARSVAHPIDLLKSATFSESLSALLGAEIGRYRTTANGPGSVDYQNETLTAKSCAAHRCEEEEQLTVADIEERKIFVARKRIGSNVAVFPDVKQWTAKSRLLLAAWARRWK